MKRLFYSIIIALTFAGTMSFAQATKLQTPPAKQPNLKPTFIIGDIYLAVQTLENVEIVGNEIEPFLQVKTTLNNILQEQQNANKKVTDSVKVDLPLPVAQNTLSFLSRAKLPGKIADQFKRFVDAIVESSKALEK
jgi:hypothetical protein